MTPHDPVEDRPDVGEDTARDIAARFGVEVGSTRRLPGERERNFLLTDSAGRRFVLKVAGRSEPADVLDMQARALSWLGERDLPVPRQVAARDGSLVLSLDAALHARLLTWLPGVPLASARPRSDDLLRDVGRLAGRVTTALAGFDHPAAHRRFDWDPAAARDVVGRHRDAVGTGAERALIDRVVSWHASQVAPRWTSLRSGIVHNDANDHNVLVAEDPLPPRRAVGLLDFGDMVEAPRVCDAAVAAAYGLLGRADPLRAAAAVVAGFHEACPLEPAELEALLALIGMRLAVSVCLSARRRSAAHEDPYLAVSEAPAWAALRSLDGVHPRFALAVFRAACGWEPSPAGARVRAWLGERAGRFAPVLEGLAAERVCVTDLSVDAAPLAPPGTDPRTWGEAIQDDVRRRGAAVGLGRYAEARLAYEGPAYAGPAGAGPDRRTIHIGVDLFAPAGTELHVALRGTVHSLADNAAPLDYGPTVMLEHVPDDGPPFHTLYGHLSRTSLAALREGQSLEAGGTLGWLGDVDENGGWPPHVHVQVVADRLDRRGDFPGVAAPSERGVWQSLCPDPADLLGLPREIVVAPPPGRGALVAERQARIGPSLSLAYSSPLVIVRGRGTYLYDEEARALIDCVNNVAHVGHAHPRVVEAAVGQSRLLNTNTRYLHPWLTRYAARLTATLPAPLRVCYFVCSGSEANELALRLARTHTGRRDVVVLDGAYHGNTSSLVDVSPYKFDGPGGSGRPDWVHVVPTPDEYRGPYRRDDPERGARYARHVTEAVARAAERGGAAALLCESLMSCGGQLPVPPGFLPAAARAVRDAGGVWIADEVQTGLGRVGSRFWAFELYGAVPDIVTMGKPIGNGHPLGAVVTTPEIAASFANGMEYFNTFGGNPVSCAVGLAVLDVIEDEGLQERAARVGGLLSQRLTSLAERHPIVGDVRGPGLFLGVDLVRDRHTREPATAAAAYVIERARELGVLLSTDGPGDNVLKIKPPLVFGEAEVERLVEVLDAVLAEDVPRRATHG